MAKIDIEKELVKLLQPIADREREKVNSFVSIGAYELAGEHRAISGWIENHMIPELAKELEEDQEELIPVVYLEDLVEQWEHRCAVLNELIIEAREMQRPTTVARLKTKLGLIRSMTQELKREIRLAKIKG